MTLLISKPVAPRPSNLCAVFDDADPFIRTVPVPPKS